MNILIAGCGRTGAELAGVLSREGHDVSVVDPDAGALALLPEDFSGYRTVGLPMDPDVLVRAGIENCDALAAVSSDDNINLMVCQLAREEFGVKDLIACVNDPRRENVYSRFGLRTICPVNITVDSLKGILLPEEHRQLRIGNHTVGFRDIPVPKRLAGVSTDGIETGSGESLFAVRRPDGSLQLLAEGSVVLGSGDRLVVCCVVD